MARTLFTNVSVLDCSGAEPYSGQVLIEDSNGNSIKLETSGVTITAAAKITVNASSIEVNSGMVTVNSGMSKFSGVVQCDVLIATTVVGSTYTPGAGNVW